MLETNNHLKDVLVELEGLDLAHSYYSNITDGIHGYLEFIATGDPVTFYDTIDELRFQREVNGISVDYNDLDLRSAMRVIGKGINNLTSNPTIVKLLNEYEIYSVNKRGKNHILIRFVKADKMNELTQLLQKERAKKEIKEKEKFFKDITANNYEGSSYPLVINYGNSKDLMNDIINNGVGDVVEGIVNKAVFKSIDGLNKLEKAICATGLVGDDNDANYNESIALTCEEIDELNEKRRQAICQVFVSYFPQLEGVTNFLSRLELNDIIVELFEGYYEGNNDKDALELISIVISHTLKVLKNKNIANVSFSRPLALELIKILESKGDPLPSRIVDIAEFLIQQTLDIRGFCARMERRVNKA